MRPDTIAEISAYVGKASGRAAMAIAAESVPDGDDVALRRLTGLHHALMAAGYILVELTDSLRGYGAGPSATD